MDNEEQPPKDVPSRTGDGVVQLAITDGTVEPLKKKPRIMKKPAIMENQVENDDEDEESTDAHHTVMKKPASAHHDKSEDCQQEVNSASLKEDDVKALEQQQLEQNTKVNDAIRVSIKMMIYNEMARLFIIIIIIIIVCSIITIIIVITILIRIIIIITII